MSADNQRLRSAIQRIAREDPQIRDVINDFKNRGGYDSTSAQVAGAEDDRQICCDGSTGSNPNPGSDTRDPGENAKDGLDPDDPANISDNLTGVTDCATGTPICFEGSDWIPPEGWEDAQSPPPDPTWQEGYSWRVTSSGQIYASPGSVSCWGPDCCLSACSGTLTKVSENQYRYQVLTPCAGGCAGFDNAIREVDETNTDPPVIETEWPEDGCVNLAIKGGKLVGSKYDPENGGSYSAPRDEIELCDGFGNSFMLAASGSIEGGFKSISGTSVDGYLYDSKGKNIARISGSEYSDPRV